MTLWVAFAMSFFPATAFAQTVDYLNNGGFEDGTTAPFTNGASRGEISLETDIQHVHSGSFALKHVANDKNSATRPWFGSLQVNHDTPGATITFSGWAKASQPNSKVRMWIFCLGPNNETDAEHRLAVNFTLGTDWQKLSMDFICDAEHPKLGIRLDNRTNGRTLWWDDLALSRQQESTVQISAPTSRALAMGGVYDMGLVEDGGPQTLSFTLPQRSRLANVERVSGPVEFQSGGQVLGVSAREPIHSGTVNFASNLVPREVNNGPYDFSLRFTVETSNGIEFFLVNGQIERKNGANAAYSLFIQNYDGFGFEFDLNPIFLPTTITDFAVVIRNDSFSETLRFNGNNLFISFIDQGFDIFLEFFGPFPGANEIPPGGEVSYPITIEVGFLAETSFFSASFDFIPDNGFSDSVRLEGNFIIDRGGDLDINLIDVVAAPSGPGVQNNGTYEVPGTVIESPLDLTFDIHNFNMDGVLIDGLSASVINAPNGSNLQVSTDTFFNEPLDPNFILSFDVNLTFDVTTNVSGPFAVEVSFFVLDVPTGGFEFSDFYSFTIQGQIDTSAGCNPQTETCPRLFIKAVTQNSPLNPDQNVAIVDVDSPLANQTGNPPAPYDKIIVNENNGGILELVKEFQGPKSVIRLEFTNEVPNTELRLGLVALQEFDNQPFDGFCLNPTAGSSECGLQQMFADDPLPILDQGAGPTLVLEFGDDSEMPGDVYHGVFQVLSSNPAIGFIFRIQGSVLGGTGMEDIEVKFLNPPDAPEVVDEGDLVELGTKGPTEVRFNFEVCNLSQTQSYSADTILVENFDPNLPQGFGFNLAPNQTLPLVLAPEQCGNIGINLVPEDMDPNDPPRVYLGSVAFGSGPDPSTYFTFDIRAVVEPTFVRVNVQDHFCGFPPNRFVPDGGNYTFCDATDVTPRSHKFVLSSNSNLLDFRNFTLTGHNVFQVIEPLPPNTAGNTFFRIQLSGQPRQTPYLGEVSFEFKPPTASTFQRYAFSIQGTINDGRQAILDAGAGNAALANGAEVVLAGINQGQTSIRDFTIQHTGGGAALSGTIQTTGSGYSVNASAFTLNSGQTQTFRVSFTGNAQGTFAGKLRIDSNDAVDLFVAALSTTVGNGGPGTGNIRVTHGPVTPVPHQSTFNFGSADFGDPPIGRNFRIWNEGSLPLVLRRQDFTVPPGYQLIETPLVPIPPPDPDGTMHYDNFSVHFNTGSTGTFNGQITFSNLSNHTPNPHIINATGTITGVDPCDGDQTPPSLTITQPANGSVFEPGAIVIRANASDSGSGMKNVKFFANNSLLGTDSSSPYQVTWQATEGNYTIKVEARDNCNNLRTRTISVTIDPCLNDQQAPTVGITVPTNGAEVEPDLIQITASAGDANGIDRVEFFVNGNDVGTDTTSPYSQGYFFTVEGTHTIVAKTYDNCGNFATDSVTITVTESGAPCDGDDVLPLGQVTFPANGATIDPGPITITATATDNVSVLAVSFEIDGSVPAGATDLAPPYTYTWDATPGSHSIRIRMLDACDNNGTSAAITVNVNNPDPCPADTTAPSVAITDPIDGSTVDPGLIDVMVNATDNAGGSGMDRVEFWINGSLRSTDTAPPWTHGHFFTIEGNQTILAKAFDQCGNMSTHQVSFTVSESGAPCDGDTQPPTGQITSPTPNSVINPGPVTLTATATDNVSVLAVAFVIDGVVPSGATDLTPPYEFTWNATPGVHDIRINMLDVCDNSGPSPTIQITVSSSEPSTVPNFQGSYQGQNLSGLNIYETGPALGFTWDHANHPAGIERYQLVVQPTDGSGWLYSPHVVFPNTSHTIQTSGLQFGLSYSYHIRAKNNDGVWGPFINAGTFHVVQPVPATVPNFQGTWNGQNLNGLTISITNPALSFTWGVPADPVGIERYQIVVQPTDGSGWLYSPHFIAPATSGTIQTSGLLPGMSYSYHIRAKNIAGNWGPFINAGTFTIQP